MLMLLMINLLPDTAGLSGQCWVGLLGGADGTQALWAQARRQLSAKGETRRPVWLPAGSVRLSVTIAESLLPGQEPTLIMECSSMSFGCAFGIYCYSNAHRAPRLMFDWQAQLRARNR